MTEINNMSRYNELVFWIGRKGRHRVLCFKIKDLNVKNSSHIKVTMEPDSNHRVPHVHISKPGNNHFASIDLSGNFIKGDGKLKKRERDAVKSWVAAHTVTLKELWDQIKDGQQDYQKTINRLDSTWEFNGHIFVGEKPSQMAEIENVRIWYDGNLTKENKNGIWEVCSSGKMCVLFPSEDMDLQGRYHFYSSCGDQQILPSFSLYQRSL